MGVDMQKIIDIRVLVAWWQRRNPRHQDMNCTCSGGGVCASYESLARAIGISHSTLFRRFNAGERITMAEADQWAGKLGVHPSAIWPTWDRSPVHASLSNPSKSRLARQ